MDSNAGTVEGSYDMVSFEDWVFHQMSHVVNSFPGRNSVIVLDNARIHYAPAAIDYLEQRGCLVMFLPPYSPDLNPIELFFQAVRRCINSVRWYSTSQASRTPTTGQN